MKKIADGLKDGKITKIKHGKNTTTISTQSDDGYEIDYDIIKNDDGTYSVSFTDEGLDGYWDEVGDNLSDMDQVTQAITKHFDDPTA